MQFSICDLLILVDVANRSIQLTCLRTCLLSNLLCLTCLGRCLLSLLIRLVGRRLSFLYSGLCTAIHVFDVASVLCGYLVELIKPIFYWRNLAIYPLFTRKWIQLTPEAFIRLGGQRLTCRIS